MNNYKYAVDIGHYLTKDNNGNLTPSRVSKVYDFGANVDKIKINGTMYYVGLGEYEIHVKKYEKQNFLPLLLNMICKSYSDEYVSIELSLGLPLIQYKNCKAELIKMLEETKYSVIHNDVPKIIEITTVNVYPEGVAAYQAVMDDYDDIICNRDVVIVEIGGGTTEICLIRDFAAVKSTSIAIGSINFYDAIKKSIEQKYIDVKIDLEKVRDYVLNGFYIDGEEQDISFAIEQSQYLFHKIMSELKLNYPITTTTVMLMGGGVELLADTFEDYIGDLIVVDDLFANANGYYMLMEGD